MEKMKMEQLVFLVQLVNIQNMMDLDVKIVELEVFLMKELKNVQNVHQEKEPMKKEMNVLNVKLVIIHQKKEVDV